MFTKKILILLGGLAARYIDPFTISAGGFERPSLSDKIRPTDPFSKVKSPFRFSVSSDTDTKDGRIVFKRLDKLEELLFLNGDVGCKSRSPR